PVGCDVIAFVCAADSFRYSCDICGKKYKYYSCFQEHRDLHAVDDPYEQVVLGPVEDIKEEPPVEPFQKMGPSKAALHAGLLLLGRFGFCYWAHHTV
uniref:C2H2-type domain-containing protein n=1 Tax=Hucho hucho TaxID=62062 RepID=A0A4W5PVB3_9TELE